MIRDVKELDVFKLAHSLVLSVYKLTENFPEEERFGLITQMRRAAFSIPMNLIEGSNRLTSKEYRRFVGIARGSTGEISYQILLAKDLGYIADEIYSKLKDNALVKSHKSPFDKLRANGGQVEIIDFIPFVVNLSNHRKDFLRDHQR